MEPTSRQAGGASAKREFRSLAVQAQGLPIPTRYAIAIAAAALGLLARLSLDAVWQGRLPYITLFPAIMVSAWLGGVGPGLITTLLCALGASYFWVPPLGSLWIVDPAQWLGLAVFVTIGLVISILNEAWRRGTVALVESEQRLAVTLASIGDAVLTTDERGYITGMNEVAERLTGWPSSEALGKAVEDVLVLVPAESGDAVSNPVRQVLRDGAVASLAGHTMLVARDGRRIPIDDSAAPIRLGQHQATGVVLVFRDITDRRRIENERQSQDRLARELAAIVETSDDAIVSKDLESTIQSWNRGAERIFGYSAEEMIGRSIRTIIPEERWSEEDEVLRQLRQGNRVDHFETIRRRKDGSEVPVSLTISPIHSASGVVIGASKIARDITERRQAEAERAQALEREQQARADIERAGRLKDDFLAVLSHELRTPLNAVLGYTQLLMAGALPADGSAHALKAIQRNAQAQARLVESLLDLSRILAGKLELNPEELELWSVLTLAVDALQPEALKANVSLQLGNPIDVRVMGDGPRLQQVFWNLLSNAIKFTPSGGLVTIDVTTTVGDVLVRVADNGRGISPALLPFVFDRFRQGEGEGAGAQAGLGLGLALVREMVHAHKGTVTAESAGEGLGAVFTVCLPVLQNQQVGVPDAGRSTRQREADLKELSPDILIVDDEPDARDMLALILEARGARVRRAGSAAEAFSAMLERRPDVLLADLGMSGEDGYSLIRRWRTHEKEGQLPRVAAIAVTAYATLRDREQALTAGYDGHIAKPVDADALVRAIATITATTSG